MTKSGSSCCKMISHGCGSNFEAPPTCLTLYTILHTGRTSLSIMADSGKNSYGKAPHMQFCSERMNFMQLSYLQDLARCSKQRPLWISFQSTKSKQQVWCNHITLVACSAKVNLPLMQVNAYICAARMATSRMNVAFLMQHTAHAVCVNFTHIPKCLHTFDKSPDAVRFCRDDASNAAQSRAQVLGLILRYMTQRMVPSLSYKLRDHNRSIMSADKETCMIWNFWKQYIFICLICHQLMFCACRFAHSFRIILSAGHTANVHCNRSQHKLLQMMLSLWPFRYRKL